MDSPSLPQSSGAHQIIPNSLRVSLSVPRWGLFVLILLLAAPWILIAVILLRLGPVTNERQIGVQDAAAQRASTTAPWGKLEFTDTTISPPLAIVEGSAPRLESSSDLDLGSGGSEGYLNWQFPDTTTSQLEKLLEGAKLRAETRTKLMDAAKSDAAINGITIAVDEDIVRRLSATSRGHIYGRLACYPRNSHQSKAYRFRGKSFAEWFHRTGLSPSTLDAIRPFVYPIGGHLHFADEPLVLPAISDEKERARLRQALCRQQTLIVKLHLDDKTSVESLVNYWGRGGRTSEVRPILESLAEMPRGHGIDIVQLLPSSARINLYTYPKSSTYMSGETSSRWASFSFFNSEPDERLVEAKERSRQLKENFYPIYGNPALGDLVAIIDEDRRIHHTASYIADDIVYTRIGSSATFPWMLIRLQHLKDYHSHRGRVFEMYYRPKEL